MIYSTGCHCPCVGNVPSGCVPASWPSSAADRYTFGPESTLWTINATSTITGRGYVVYIEPAPFCYMDGQAFGRLNSDPSFTATFRYLLQASQQTDPVTFLPTPDYLVRLRVYYDDGTPDGDTIAFYSSVLANWDGGPGSLAIEAGWETTAATWGFSDVAATIGPGG